MWAGFAHLTVGNAIIGVIEGLLLAWVFRLPPLRAVPVMILANYFSMGVGVWAFDPVIEPFGQRLMEPAPLYSAPRVIISLAVLSYLATIFLEWPFCFWIMNGCNQRARRSFYASCLAQTASYALLVPFYLAASGFTLYTNLALDPSLSYASNGRVSIYYISSGDGNVYQVRPDGTANRQVCAAHIQQEDARLFLRPEHISQRWDLWAVGSPGPGKERMILRGLTGQAALNQHQSADRPENGTWFNCGLADDLCGRARSDWCVETGFWPVEGLQARNWRSKEEVRAALETPFVSWPSRNATVLPGDEVVYQLGDQVVLLDLRTCRIRLITRGRGPVVLLDQ